MNCCFYINGYKTFRCEILRLYTHMTHKCYIDNGSADLQIVSVPNK
jgi:hypothetical protein